MTITEIFQVLGIEETKDEAIIKRGYREKLAVTNPEDNPEGFKRLRMAYEEACNYAKSEEAEAVEDESPSGQWVAKAAAIYARMDTRQNVVLWKGLFDEDVFLSLEEEENCRRKLLVFLMDHYKLPTDVWKLLDEKLNLVEDYVSLKEHFPTDFVSYVVNRCKQGEEIRFDKFEGEPDADYDLFMQYSNNCWDALCEEQLEQAEEFIQNADDLKIYHPVMEINRAWLFEKQGKLDEAVKQMEKLVEKDPEDVMALYHLAEILWKSEQKDRAGEVFEKICTINKKHYMSNVRLTEWYYEKKRYKDAKSCAEEILSHGVEDDFRELLGKINHELEKDMEAQYLEHPNLELGLELGWCYLQDGRYSKGIALVRNLAEQVTEEKKSEYRGLMSKLYAESSYYKEAIQMAERWEEALLERLDSEQDEESRKKDEDRWVQSYAIRAFCYRRMAYKEKENFTKAIECIDKAQKDKEPDINLMLEKAYIYAEMEEPEQCLDICRVLLEDHRIYAAYATQQEAYRRMWDAEGVLQSGYNCIHYFPDYLRAYERIARVYADLKYDEELKKLLEDAKEKNLQSVYLDAYSYRMTHEIPDNDTLEKKLETFREEYLQKVEEGQLAYYEKGLPLITEYLYWCPGAYMLIERGLFHKAAAQYDKAMEDFSKALDEEPGNPYALNAMAHCFKMKGEYEKAVITIRRAIFYFDEEYARTYSNLGDLYSLLGEYEMALESYMEVLRVGGESIQENGYYMYRYACALNYNHKLSEAEAVLNKAYQKPLERYGKLTELYYASGEKEKCLTCLKLWRKLLDQSPKIIMQSEYASYYDAMAWSELVFGEPKKALDYFEKDLQCRKQQDNISGNLCDAIFASILCGDDERARRYAVRLRDYMEKEKKSETNQWLEMDKLVLVRELLCQYYYVPQEVFEATLGKEQDTAICYFCTYCFCKEVEGIRILHLLRMGKEQEALEQVKKNLKRQPEDEYMRAILNICKDGVKVVPYSVNGFENEGQNPEEAESMETSSVGKSIKKLLKGAFTKK